MHAKPDLRVFLKWMIYRSGSVITDVTRLIRQQIEQEMPEQRLFSQLLMILAIAVCVTLLGCGVSKEESNRQRQEAQKETERKSVQAVFDANAEIAKKYLPLYREAKKSQDLAAIAVSFNTITKLKSDVPFESCPADFRVAYRQFIDAREKCYQLLTQAMAAHEGLPTGFDRLLEDGIRAEQGRPPVRRRLDDLLAEMTVTERLTASLWAEVERVAAPYGVAD